MSSYNNFFGLVIEVALVRELVKIQYSLILICFSSLTAYRPYFHSDPILLNYVGCDGTELNILDCDHYGNIGGYYSSDCNSYIAEVTCQC